MNNVVRKIFFEGRESMDIKITTLIENSLGEHLALYNEHGISFYIETERGNILFDTGKSGRFIDNAEQLNIDLKNTDYVILSHGHYDHTGGFKKFVERFGHSFQLCISPLLLKEKYGYDGKAYQFLGNNFDEEFLKQKEIETRFITESIVEIIPGVFAATHFKRNAPFEKLNNRFYISKDGEYVLDSFEDEIVVVVETQKGLVVLLGCCHPGIVNILSTLIEKTGKNIYGILGGTHLVEADQERTKLTMEYLKEIEVKILGISHCTGDYAMSRLQEEHKEQFFHNCTGTSIEVHSVVK
jgi:7,8-dihydropterin-6-yl-methyl-4-(beta-D-ribofuranosyl)aminobenzene 5'-phosphate synthase